jgi:hypothetical protein
VQKERIEIDNGRTTVRARPQPRVSENPPGAQRIPTRRLGPKSMDLEGGALGHVNRVGTK